MLKTDVFLLLILFVFSLSEHNCTINFNQGEEESCVFFQDSFLQFVKSKEDVISFRFTTKRIRGLTSFGWSKTRNISENSFQFVYIFPNITFMYLNNSIYTNDEGLYKSNCYDHNYYDDLMKVWVSIPRKFIENMNFTIFSRNEYVSEYNLTDFKMIPKNIKDTPIISQDFHSCFIPYIGRIEVTNSISFVFIMYLYLLAFTLMVFLRNSQPFQSRSLIPYVSLVVHIANLFFSYLLAQGTFEDRSEYGCPYWVLGSIILIETTFITPVIVFMRYLLVINMNKYKEGDRRSFKYLFLKYLASPLSQGIILGLYVFILILISLIIYVAVGSKCSDPLRRAFIFKYVFFAWIVIFLIILLQTYDLVKNFKWIMKCKLRKFIQRDPFFFRIEMILTISLFITYTFFYIGTLIRPISTFSLLVVNSFFTFWLFFNQIGFSLMITLYLKIKFYFSSEQLFGIDVVLNDPKLLKMFETFTNNEMSIENLFAKREIIEYRKSTNKEDKALEIKERFLADKPIYSLTIESSVINQTVERIDKKTFTDDLFDEMEHEVNLNLLDTLNRFHDSPEYIQFMKEREFKKDLLSTSATGEKNEESSLININ